MVFRILPKSISPNVRQNWDLNHYQLHIHIQRSQTTMKFTGQIWTGSMPFSLVQIRRFWIYKSQWYCCQTNSSCQLFHSHYFFKESSHYLLSKDQVAAKFGFCLFGFFSILGASWPELGTDAEYFVALQEGYAFSANSLDVQAQQYKSWYTHLSLYRLDPQFNSSWW